MATTKLTKAFIEQAPDGVYTDPLTPGLSLRVRSGGKHRAWVFRRMVDRSRKDVGLGGVASVTLAQARLAAMQLRMMSDEDFLEHIQAKRTAKQAAVSKPSEADSGLTFRDVCNKFMEWNVRVGNWEDWNKSHRCFETIMRLHVFPHIGDMPFAKISAKDVAKIGAEIWDQTDLVDRSLQFTRQTFDWGKANDFLTETIRRTVRGHFDTCCHVESTSSSTEGRFLFRNCRSFLLNSFVCL